MSLNAAVKQPFIPGCKETRPATRAYCFKAPWADSSVYIRPVSPITHATEDHIVRNGLSEAVVLAELEPICQSVACLFDRSLDFRPTDVSEVDTLDRKETFLSALVISDDQHKAEVFMPVCAWSMLQRTWSCANRSEIRWLPVPVTLHLEDVQLDAIDIEKLAVGSLLLLPGSFLGTWMCTLNVSSLGVTRHCGIENGVDALNVKLSAPSTHVARQTATTGRESISVFLESPLTLDPAVLLDNRHNETTVLSVERQEVYFRCDTHSRGRLTGSLLPLAGGYGVYIQAQY